MLLISGFYQKKKIKFWNSPSSEIYEQPTITLSVTKLGVCVFEMTKHGRQIKCWQHGMCFHDYGMCFILLILLYFLIIYLKLLSVNFLIMQSRTKPQDSRNISQNHTKLVSLLNQGRNNSFYLLSGLLRFGFRFLGGGFSFLLFLPFLFLLERRSMVKEFSFLS